ncbi:hypothetical protein MASR2M78_05580 [Treponema sp.]
MDYERFTVKAQDALREASSIAQKSDQTQVELEHILLALIEQEDGIVAPLLDRIGADSGQTAGEMELSISKKPKVFGDSAQLFFAPPSSRVLAKAEAEASALKDDYVSTEHILIALSLSEGLVAKSLKSSGVTKDAILSALKAVRGNSRVTDQNPEEKYQVLDKYCCDSHSLARQEKLDPVTTVGRRDTARHAGAFTAVQKNNLGPALGSPV